APARQVRSGPRGRGRRVAAGAQEGVHRGLRRWPVTRSHAATLFALYLADDRTGTSVSPLVPGLVNQKPVVRPLPARPAGEAVRRREGAGGISVPPRPLPPCAAGEAVRQLAVAALEAEGRHALALLVLDGDALGASGMGRVYGRRKTRGRTGSLGEKAGPRIVSGTPPTQTGRPGKNPLQGCECSARVPV